MPLAAPEAHGTFLLPPCAPWEHGGGMSPSMAAQLLVWVDGTLTVFVRGENAFCEQTGLLPASLLGCPSRC